MAPNQGGGESILPRQPHNTRGARHTLVGSHLGLLCQQRTTVGDAPAADLPLGKETAGDVWISQRSGINDVIMITLSVNYGAKCGADDTFTRLKTYLC